MTRCHRCGCTEFIPCTEKLYASDETVQATHECAKCHERFRRTEADAWRPDLYVNLPAPLKET